MTPRTILLKLTGSLIKNTHQDIDAYSVKAVASQIKELSPYLTFGVVIGGSNFFNGSRQSHKVQIASSTGHTVGIIATLMNSLIMQDIFEQEGIKTTIFSALDCGAVGLPLSPQALREAKRSRTCMIFAGGTGNPYFSTDTTAIVRALQLQTNEVWKGTNVDGIYTDDPHKNPHAQFIARVSYSEALEKKLGIMDSAAFALADTNNLTVRVVNIFSENALIKMHADTNFGSTLFTLNKKGTS